MVVNFIGFGILVSFQGFYYQRINWSGIYEIVSDIFCKLAVREKKELLQEVRLDI